MSTTTKTAPKIYVASLADYNDGRLVGKWIDADQSADEIHAEIQEMLATSPLNNTIYGPAEEYAIHDYEGFEGVRLSEYESISTVATLAELIAEHGTPFALWADYKGSVSEAAETFEDAYSGEWESLAAYAEDLVESCGGYGIPEEFVDYVDFERWGAATLDMVELRTDSQPGVVFLFNGNA